MNVEQNRLETFSDWPSDAVVSPMRIAKAGFYSIKQGLTVQCFSCGCQISEWNYGDQVMARHRLLNPQCPFVLNPTTTGNVPNIPPAPVAPPSGPSEGLKQEETRLESFQNWPASSVVTGARLARAGFYFLNYEDKVRCAFCGGIVGCWEAGDDPDKVSFNVFEISFKTT